MNQTAIIDLDETTPLPPLPSVSGTPSASRSWLRRLGHDTAYAITALPLSIAAFVLALAGVLTGTVLLIVVIGLPILALTAIVARGFAHAERVRMRSLQGRPAPTPEYRRAERGDSWWRRVTTPLRDPQSWLDIVWSLLSVVTGMVASIVALAWWAVVLNGFTYWFWQQWLPDSPEQQGLAELIGLGDSRATESALNAAIGIVALALAPLVMRLAALVHAGPADIMLCSRASLQTEVRRVTGGRDAARRAEADALRRLERDIHDGPQQRLVRLAMDLGRARQHLGHDPERGREAVDSAYQQAREAIDELRALSRGIAPPLLVDRGLGPALEELVARQHETVGLRIDPAALTGLAPHLESCVYFVVAEAMTNVAKHSGAELVDVLVQRDGDALTVQVTDDGVGGASTVKGSGLAGLEQRVRGLGGTLSLTSPAGGPTVVRVDLPTGDESHRP